MGVKQWVRNRSRSAALRYVVPRISPQKRRSVLGVGVRIGLSVEPAVAERETVGVGEAIGMTTMSAVVGSLGAAPVSDDALGATIRGRLSAASANVATGKISQDDKLARISLTVS